MSTVYVGGRRVWLHRIGQHRRYAPGALMRYQVTLPGDAGYPAIHAGTVYQVEIPSRRLAPYWEAVDLLERRVTVVPLETRREAVEMLVRAALK